MAQSQTAVSNGMKEQRGQKSTPLQEQTAPNNTQGGTRKLRYGGELGPIVERNIKLRLPENLLLFLEEVSTGHDTAWTVEDEVNYALSSTIIMMIVERDCTPILESNYKGTATLQELFDKYGMSIEILDKIANSNFHNAILEAARCLE